MWIDVIAALAPIFILLLMMVHFHWGASLAGPIGWITAAGLGFLRFGMTIEILAWSQVSAFLLALDVLLIVWGAFLLYRVVSEAGAIDLLRDSLSNLSTDPCMQGLLIAWAFASFLQGVGGFGVPVAVAAPVLIGLGFAPLTAVVAPSIGHAWAVTFGSLASSFQALIAASGVDGHLLAPVSALLLAAAGYGCGVAVVVVIDGWKGARRMAVPILVMGTAMGAAQYAVVTRGFWNLGGISAGLAGLLAGLFLTRFFQGGHGRNMTPAESAGAAYLPYLILIILTVSVQFMPGFRSFLGGFRIQVDFPALETTRGFITPPGESKEIVVFRHAGAILFFTSMLSYAYFKFAGRLSQDALGRISADTLKKVISPSIGIVAMVSMAVIMANTGMTQILAQRLASIAGVIFPAVSVWIGALGAFITGSNTNSNVLFALLQRRTAEILQLPLPLILAAQTSGAALGSIVSPTKIIVGASTTKMSGQEGLILKALLRTMLVLLSGLSLIVLAAAYLR